MLRGEVVTFEIEGGAAGTDPLGSPVAGEPRRVDVEDVLVATGDASDASSSTRVGGADIALTIYVPKAYRGEMPSRVRARGSWYRVAGRPQAWPDDCPTRWNVVMELEANDG